MLTLNLSFCVREGHVKIVQHFLDVLPDIWHTVSNNGRTPMHTAGISYIQDVPNVLTNFGVS